MDGIDSTVQILVLDDKIEGNPGGPKGNHFNINPAFGDSGEAFGSNPFAFKNSFADNPYQGDIFELFHPSIGFGL